MQPVLFYSRSCQSCQRLISQLKSHGDALRRMHLQIYCIDDGNIQIPPTVQYVPSLVVFYPGMNKGAETYQRKECFDWFSRILNANQQKSNDGPTSGPTGVHLANATQPEAKANGGIPGDMEPYDRTLQQGGWSSSFSLFNQSEEQNKNDMDNTPMSRFELVSGQVNTTGHTHLPPPQNTSEGFTPPNPTNLLPNNHNNPWTRSQGVMNTNGSVPVTPRPASMDVGNKPGADELKRRMDELQRERSTVANGPPMSFGPQP